MKLKVAIIIPADVVVRARGPLPMIVCLCAGVNDRELRELARQGCDTPRAVAARTGAGADCGACACDLRRILRQAREAETAEAARAAPALAAK